MTTGRCLGRHCITEKMAGGAGRQGRNIFGSKSLICDGRAWASRLGFEAHAMCHLLTSVQNSPRTCPSRNQRTTHSAIADPCPYPLSGPFKWHPIAGVPALSRVQRSPPRPFHQRCQELAVAVAWAGCAIETPKVTSRNLRPNRKKSSDKACD